MRKVKETQRVKNIIAATEPLRRMHALYLREVDRISDKEWYQLPFIVQFYANAQVDAQDRTDITDIFFTSMAGKKRKRPNWKKGYYK